MITALTSPQYVNRIRQDWTANGGVYGDGGVYMATPANNPFAQLGPTLDLVFAGTATDPLDVASTTDDTLSLNFTAEAYQIAAQYAVWGTGGLQAVNFADIVTFTRASTGTFFDFTGTLQTAAINAPRFDFNPSTLAAQGLLIEEARTNSIRNNTMQGAVAGTPGTLPTNWAVVFNAVTGLTSSVVGTGTENGITYIDVRINGTPSASVAQGVQILFDTLTGISASASQVWTESSYLKIAAGSAANIPNFRFNIQQFNGGVFVQSNNTVITAPSTTLTRASATSTFSASTTTHALPLIALETTASAAIDITLRIGLPQLEQGAFATSVIPTTTTALTRSADVASVNTLSPWFNATEGAIYTEFVIGSTAPTTGFPTASAFTDNTINNRIAAAYLTNSTDTLDYFIGDGGATQALLSTGAYSAGTVAKMASAYAANNFAVCRGGGAVGTDTSGTVPTINVLHLGNQLSGSQLGGYLRRVTYYPRRLANADLQTITA